MKTCAHHLEKAVTITELIEELEAIKAKAGNLDVIFRINAGNSKYRSSVNVNQAFIRSIPNESGDIFSYCVFEKGSAFRFILLDI